MDIPASFKRNGSISVNVDEKLSFVNPSICFFTVTIFLYGFVDSSVVSVQADVDV